MQVTDLTRNQINPNQTKRHNPNQTAQNNHQLARNYRNSNSKDVKVLHYNCNAIKEKVVLFQSLIKNLKPDIISLNELKCNEVEANYSLDIDGYIPYYKVRNENGGGVAILVNEDLQHNLISLPDTFDHLEIIGTTIHLKNRKVSFFSYYNPPSMSISKDLFQFIEDNYRDHLICGDLNARTSLMGNGKNANGRLLEEMIIDSGDQILNVEDKPTSYRLTHIQQHMLH